MEQASGEKWFPGEAMDGGGQDIRQVNVRLPGREYSNSIGARPVHQIISMIKWIRTSMMPIKNSLYHDGVGLFLLVVLNRSAALLPVAVGG